MHALLFDETLADALDDGNARRGWFTDLQWERSARVEASMKMKPVRSAYPGQLRTFQPVYETVFGPAQGTQDEPGALFGFADSRLDQVTAFGLGTFPRHFHPPTHFPIRP